MSLDIEEIYFQLKACVIKRNVSESMASIIDKNTYTAAWRLPRKKMTRMQNIKYWQLFYRRRTGASGNVSIAHLASHGVEHSSMYR
jgi:hypothetical protein